MKIVVGSIQQETNTFSPVKPCFNDFDFVSGKKMLEKIVVTDFFMEAGVELIPTIYANAVPSGKLDKESFMRLCNELVWKIPDNEKIDGIWLYLHGAMEVENIGSGEVAILAGIREKVGFDVPIAVALDFHANNSEKIVEFANIICGYRTAPHVDMKETQVRAARHLLYCICEKILPKPVIIRIPLVLTGDMVITAEEPAKSIMKEAEKVEEKDDFLDVSIFNGQPWVDAPNTGASVVITSKSDRKAALEEAWRLARIFWNARLEFGFAVEACETEAAVELALKANIETVIISDSGDNTTAGAAGENTLLLRILSEKNADRTLVAGITDGNAVQECFGRKLGSTVDLMVGAGIDQEKSHSFRLKGIMIRRGCILGWGGEDAGRAVVISSGGIDVILTEKRCAFISPQIINSIGVNMLEYKIIVVKLGYLYPELAKLAKRAIIALTPGASCEAIEKLEFRNIQRPFYPKDPEFEWNM